MRRYFMLFVLMLFTVTIPTTAQACLAPILDVDETGRVLGVPNRLRAEPSISGQILTEIPGGNTFSVLETGPCVEGIRWLRVEYRDIVGWTAESADGEAFVEIVTITAGGFVPLQNGGTGGMTINADGTLLASGAALYNANDLSQPPRILNNRSDSASVQFSPTNPDLMFRYYVDHEFALVNVRDNRTIWSEGMDPPTGIGGGIYFQEAYFTPDGTRIVFSSTALEYAWSVLDVETLTLSAFDRSYFGETVALAPDGITFTRHINPLRDLSAEIQPTMSNTNLTTFNAGNASATARRLSSFADMLYLPDGRLLTVDRSGVVDVWDSDLTYQRTLAPLPGTSTYNIVGWDVGSYPVLMQQTTTDGQTQIIVSLLDTDTLEELGRITAPLNGELRGGDGVLFHPDGHLGVKMLNAFRWFDTEAIVDGILTTFIPPT